MKRTLTENFCFKKVILDQSGVPEKSWRGPQYDRQSMRTLPRTSLEPLTKPGMHFIKVLWNICTGVLIDGTRSVQLFLFYNFIYY